MDILDEPDLPLGLLLSSVGGTTIEQWSRANVALRCNGIQKNLTDFNLFNTMVAPLVNMSVSTLLWYQGENNVGEGTLPGNITNRSGYACALADIIADWRALRSQPELPVGIFALAPGGSEGHSEEMAAFRAAQTTFFGSLPSPALKHSFFVPTHDLGDPCNKHSRSTACTGNGSFSYKCPKGQSCGAVTHFRDSRIHSRVKRAVGARAAHAAAALIYSVPRPSVGPVVSDCFIDKLTGTIIVHFQLATGIPNSSLASESWRFALDSPFPRDEANKWSAFEVRLVRPDSKVVWIPVNASVITDTKGSSIELSSRTEPVYAATGVRYAWSEQPCCAAVKQQNNGNCIPGSCPLWTVATRANTNDKMLPALPFQAEIGADGRCHCELPQHCDAARDIATTSTERRSMLEAPSQLMCELRREPAGVLHTSMLFTWSYPPSTKTVAGFQVWIMSSAKTVVWTSGKIASPAASYQYRHATALRPATRYFWTVSFYHSSASEISPRAVPRLFSTAIETWDVQAIWLMDNTPDVRLTSRGKPDPIKQPTLAQFRKTVHIGFELTSALLFIAAERTHKQLGSFKLFVNGHPTSMGPGRSAINSQLDDVSSAYDSFDLTDSCNGSNVLALGVQCFAAETHGQLVAILKLSYANGTTFTLGTDSSWRARNATASFGPIGTAGTQYYTQPHAFLDARLFDDPDGNVHGWALPGFDDATWGEAVPVTNSYYRSAPLSAKPTPALQLLSGTVEITEELGPGHWTFRVPREIQGGIHLRVTGAQAGTTAIVRLGEELLANTTQPMFHMRTGNLYQDIWTLRDGTNELQAHEYVEFSRGELILQPPNALKCAKTSISGSKLVPAYIQCPSANGVVEAVTFAEYGQTTGKCLPDGSNTFHTNSSCSVSVVAAFKASCVGRHRCEIKVPSGTHEPCHGPKSVAVAVECNDTKTGVYNGNVADSLSWLPSAVNLSTWIVRYPWNDTDSSFSSNSVDLNKVFAFAKYSIEALSLDMWTDSNTRQRDVNCNEANGIVPLMQSAVALEFMSQRWTSRCE